MTITIPKVLSRDFTPREKALMALLVLMLFGFGYYYFFDQPVRNEIARCEAQKANLEIELNQINVKLNVLETMQEELENIEASGDVSEMKSYNASKEEIRLLNDVLARANEYSISFADVTRSGDQIRRNFKLSFNAANYQVMSDILAALSNSPLRCRISDVSCARATLRILHYVEVVDDGGYNVSATATGYETMVGGTEDAGLPASKK